MTGALVVMPTLVLERGGGCEIAMRWNRIVLNIPSEIIPYKCPCKKDIVEKPRILIAYWVASIAFLNG